MFTSMFRKAMLGDSATLNLDFTTGTFDSRLTFTRSGTGTYINSSGYVTTASTNVPRFDYDPTTLAPRGLLIESQAINTIRYSSAPQSWVAAVSGTTITDGSGLAPNNSSTPKQLAMTSGGYCYQVTQANQTAGTYTFSVWLKASSAQSVGMRVSRTGDGSVKGMITAAVTTSWQRFQVQITNNATDTLDCGFDQRSLPPSVPGPAVAATFLMWGAQLEAGSGASSNIETTASQVTRVADECTITGTNFSSFWPLSQSAFTVYWDGDITRSPANTQFYWLTRAGGSSRSRGYVTTGSLIRANNTAYDFTLSPTTSMTVGTRFKSAVAISSGSSAMYGNNSSVTGSDTSAGAVTLFDADSLNFNPNAENFMHIRSFKFYNTRLTNAELLALVS